MRFDLQQVLVYLESTHVPVNLWFFHNWCLFYVFCAVFCVLRRPGAMGGKVRSEIERIHWTLFGISVTITGISCKTNRTWKYSNRAQRCPTLSISHLSLLFILNTAWIHFKSFDSSLSYCLCEWREDKWLKLRYVVISLGTRTLLSEKAWGCIRFYKILIGFFCIETKIIID